MHDPHDDLLERELSRLSEYTGEQPTTPLWQQAIDNHRREQQQRLWVWVRRPAPALAAAGLAVLVASVALRPMGVTAPVNGRTVAATKNELAERFQETKLATAVKSDSGVSSEAISLSRDVTLNAPALEDHSSRVRDAGNDRSTGSVSVPDNDVLAAAGTGGGGGTGVATKSGVPVEGGPAGGRGSGADDPRAALGGGVNRNNTRKTEESPTVFGGVAPGSPPPPTADAPTPSLTPAAVPNLPLKAGWEAEYADKLSNLSAIPEPTANLALAVQDVGTFYKYVPTLLNQKLGEQVVTQQMAGTGKDEPQVYNATLRVNEDRLPEVLEELKKSGKVQAQSGQQLAKETRLTQLDALMDAEKLVAIKTEEAAKEMSNKDADAEALAARSKEAKGTIEALNRRRSQIEKGGELATINIVAVPEAQVRAQALPTPLAPPAAAPAAPKAPGATAARPSGGAAPKVGGGTAAAPTTTADPTPASVAGSNVDKTPDDSKRQLTTGTPPAGEFSRSVGSKTVEQAGSNDDPAKKEMYDLAGSQGAQPPPGAVPAPSGSKVAPTTAPAPAAPVVLPPSSALPPPPPPPAPSTPEAVTPGAPAQAGLPKGTIDRAEQDGKLKQAAREGLSSLGDSTASVVRNGIATMLYWVPALVLVVGGAWWWRRKAAAAAKEPPPQ